jgi:hypothetical protein
MELDSARPYFTFANFGLRRPTIAKALSDKSEVLDPRVARIEGLIANDGRRSATDVSGALIILPIYPNEKLGTFPLSIADDMAPKSEWHVGTGLLSVIPDDLPAKRNPVEHQDPGFFVMIYVRYRDTLTSKTYKQRSFMRWPGISNGVVAGNLISADNQEKTSLIQHYAEFLRPYMGEH